MPIGIKSQKVIATKGVLVRSVKLIPKDTRINIYRLPRDKEKYPYPEFLYPECLDRLKRKYTPVRLEKSEICCKCKKSVTYGMARDDGKYFHSYCLKIGFLR